MQRVLFFAFFLLLYEKAIPQFVRHLGRKKIWIPDTKTFSAPLVRRAFRLEFFPSNPRRVPLLNAFHKLVKRFVEDAAGRPELAHFDC